MNTLMKIDNYDGAREKLIFINDLRNQNVAYLGPQEIYEEFLCKNSSKMLYVMYMDYAVRASDTVRWSEQIDLFFRILQSYRYHSGVQLVVIDSEIHPNVCQTGKMYIELYDKGNLVCEDLFAKEGGHLQVCTVKIKKFEKCKKMPNKMVFLEVQCPMSSEGKCPTDTWQWSCRNCKDLIQYDVKNDYLYCYCGKAFYTNALFRCSEKAHGIEYVRFPPLQAEEVFSELKKVEETNILILGETGVGKSTWINALANYLQFPTLQEASESEDIKVLIPSRFSYTSETGETKSIAVGTKSDNEVLAAGQSATQGPQAYKFNVGKRIICLIDTPGIGDVRGLEQDEKNFENILSHLAYYDEIHGICILLKPNDSRLSVTFRFCITELLTHLHKTAAQNVMFCFTNARGTFYRPGDTLPVLQKLVSEYKVANVKIDPSNQFCFDNESFRFLACMRNGIKFKEKDIETYSSSWDHSVAETKRLFEYVQGLHPHAVKETMSLNNAHRIILELSKPLAEISTTIQKNIDAANRKANELKASKATASDLQNKLYLDAVDLLPVELDYPRTVCTDATCVEYVTLFDDTKKTVYSRQCHEHCYLKGIPTETLNNPALQRCQAMDGGQSTTCIYCGHSWKVHMHLTYDLEQVAKRVVDRNVADLINEKGDDATKIKKFIEDVNLYADELREEQQKITDICAQFGCYLKKNAITPYNDQIDAHIEMLINQEESRPDRNQRTIDNLVAMRRKYSEKKQVISRAMQNPDLYDIDFISSPEKVDELKKTLFQLKHNGETLRNIFYQIQRVQSEYRHCQA